VHGGWDPTGRCMGSNGQVNISAWDPGTEGDDIESEQARQCMGLDYSVCTGYRPVVRCVVVLLEREGDVGGNVHLSMAFVGG
jgi:hypothetical protein